MSPSSAITAASIEFDSSESPQTLRQLSPWTASGRKRAFDVTFVLAVGPFLLPFVVIIALLVRLSSRGPAIFRQERIGRFGLPFTIYKFRTMTHHARSRQPSIALLSIDRMTPLGQVLRFLKLDEIPQLFNVLIGDMSLVGPRPRIPDHQLDRLACRPGITGAATLLFAREEQLLAAVPRESLPKLYREIVLPAKHSIDCEYMSKASFGSDLRILVATLSWRWLFR